METKHEEGCRQKINIIRHDAKSCRYKNGSDVKRIFDISIRPVTVRTSFFWRWPAAQMRMASPKKIKNIPIQISGNWGFAKITIKRLR